jgi:hypothetical protein
LKHS